MGNKTIKILNYYIRPLFVVNDCTYCPLSHWRFLNQDGSAYDGLEYHFNDKWDLLIVTKRPFRDHIVIMEAYLDPVTQPDCTIIQHAQVTMNFEVCGTENITVTNYTEPFFIHNWIKLENNYELPQSWIDGWLQSNSTVCPMSFALRYDPFIPMKRDTTVW